MSANTEAPANITIFELENEIIEAVILGQRSTALRYLADFNADFNNAGYCHEFNALMRKAAERGGVHSVYVMENSIAITEKIDSCKAEALPEIFKEIINTYCELVQKKAQNQYSTPVQRAIVKIHHDLTCDISLKALAQFNNMSAGYFSALFKRETGLTLTDYVNQKRIERAKKLLKTTHLQIKEISLQCGVSDINYFTKLFKKYVGVTPKDFKDRK